MIPFLIVGTVQKKVVAKLLKPFGIDPIDITRIGSLGNAIGIDAVREMKRKVSLKPFAGGSKAFVIEDAHTLTEEAQNALLKTLEEPPVNTVFVLTSRNEDLILPTIVSRCQVLRVTTVHPQLPTDEFSMLHSQFFILLQGGVGEKLRLAQNVGKSRTEAILWLEKMVVLSRQKLLDSAVKGDVPSDYHNVVRSLQQTYTLVTTTNVSPRFALEHLLLNL